jgi:hypothetical protein
VEQSVATNGSVLTTDGNGTGASASEPVQASVTSPNSGTLSIGQADAAGMTLSGYFVVGQVVHIVAPPATPNDPLSLSFEIASAVAGGTTADSISLFRNGSLVGNCTGGPGVAIPDPCVSARLDLPNGNLRLTVLSSGASVWALGVSKAISVGSASVVEGNDGKPRALAFPVTLTSPPSTNVTVRYTIAPNGSAIGATKPATQVDFKRKSGTLTFKAGTATTKYVTASVFPDSTEEGDETFDVELSSPTGGYALGSSHATGTILGDEPSGGTTASVGDAHLWEGHAGRVNNAKVFVNLSSPATSTVSLVVTVGGGNAIAGVDYKKSFTKTLTFTAGQWQKTVAVSTLPEIVHDGERTVSVTLSNPNGGVSLGRSTGTVFINDDD